MPAVYREEDLRINGDPEHSAELFRRDRDRMLAFADVPDAELAAVTPPTLVADTGRRPPSVGRMAVLGAS